MAYKANMAMKAQPAEGYCEVGVRIYPDGSMEPFILETGQALAVDRCKLDMTMDTAMKLQFECFVSAVKMMPAPEPA